MSDNLEEFLRELVSCAARETLPHFRSINAIENKKDEGFDPVTVADRNAEKAIRRMIMEQLPDHGIIGEEFGDHNSDAETTWVIDPIDGTKSFVSGLPLWGTLIAKCENNVPVSGVMSQPYIGELFIGNAGVSRFEKAEKSSILKTSDADTIAEATLMCTHPDIFTPGEYKTFQRLAAKTQMLRYGTDCYGYCMLAAGQVDLVVEAGLSFYDIAALIPIIEYAGGVVTDWQGNPFNDSGQVVAAANHTLHQKAISYLN